MSRVDVDNLLKELLAQNDAREKAATGYRIIRESALLGFLLAAYLQYGYWDVSLRIAALPSLQVFIPVGDGAHASFPYRPSGL